jgi:glycolate oxidase
MNRNLMKAYERDASGFVGKARDVVFPKNVQEVKVFVGNSKRVVVRGGATGLAGGCVPENGLDLVLDLSKMDKISNFDNEKKTIEVEAGVILDELQIYLSKFGLEFPVKPSSHSVATIGGMIATDAVGSRAIKYGKTSNWVKWLDVVDCYGEIHRKGVTELSDYCGMEGITGVVVKACLKLSPLKSRSATLVSVATLEEITGLVKNLKRNSEISMIEFFDKGISEKLGFEKNYHLIVEYESDRGELKGHEYEKLMSSRDRVYPLLASEGYFRIEDPKVLLDRSGKLLGWLVANKVPVFGHIGVGIFHPCFKDGQIKLVREMMKIVVRLGGQISGEHGIGVLKKDFVEGNDKKILLNVKKRCDPLNKFNVGKVV